MRGLQPRMHGLRAGGFYPSARFFVCLKQDGQDEQDGQDRASQERVEKV